MTQKKALVQAGIFGNTAAAILGDVATGVSAAGTTQATATALTANVNVIGTAAASSGVVLPASEAGDVIEVYNQGANVGGQSAFTINGAVYREGMISVTTY
jgi:hypothetical protein